MRANIHVLDHLAKTRTMRPVSVDHHIEKSPVLTSTLLPVYGQETHKATNETTHSPTGINTGSAYDPSTRPTISQDGASALSMKSGVLGSSDQATEERALRSDGITGQTSPAQSQK